MRCLCSKDAESYGLGWCIVTGIAWPSAWIRAFGSGPIRAPPMAGRHRDWSRTMLGLRRTGRLRRVTALVAAGMTAATAVVACSSSAAPADTGGSATSGTVNWWGWSPSAQAAQAAIAAFNKVYPHIKVNYKLLPVTGVGTSHAARA